LRLRTDHGEAAGGSTIFADVISKLPRPRKESCAINVSARLRWRHRKPNGAIADECCQNSNDECAKELNLEKQFNRSLLFEQSKTSAHDYTGQKSDCRQQRDEVMTAKVEADGG